MTTFRRQRFECILEKSSLPRLFEASKRCGVTGHTQLPVLGGRGQHGTRINSKVVSFYESVMIIAVMKESVAQALAEASKVLTKEQIGVVFISDLEVLRNDHC